jgi:hypothetical protein
MNKEFEFFSNTIKAINNALNIYEDSYKINYYYNDNGDVELQEYVFNDSNIFKIAMETINKRMLNNCGIYDGMMLQYDTGRKNNKLWIGCTLSINMFRDFSIELFYEQL